MSIPIDVLIQAGDWPELNVSLMIDVAQRNTPNPHMGELSVVFTDDEHIQALNFDYRNKDKPTNVLSFPQDGLLLGDIVLALETITREAAEKSISFEHHVTHLIIHGFLHLQGYDHQTETDAAEMEALEIAALAALNIDNPYEIRD